MFNAAGVEIMSPLPLRRDGNVTTIPAANRRDGYVPTGFRLLTWFLILRTLAPRRISLLLPAQAGLELVGDAFGGMVQLVR